MRISDWSSDVCSSDLIGALDRVAALAGGEDPFAVIETAVTDDRWSDTWRESGRRAVDAWSGEGVLERPMALPWIEGSGEIGRAACRERVCQYVKISEVAVSLKQTQRQQPNTKK